MYQKNIGSKLDNDCASSERKSSEETRTSNYHMTRTAPRALLITEKKQINEKQNKTKNKTKGKARWS